jgi:hypothetical protein
MVEKFKIDYENPDVEDIMRQVRERIDAQMSENTDTKDVKTAAQTEPRSPVPQLPEPAWEPLPISRTKNLLLKLTRPFSPLIKLLALPIHQELVETVRRLDFTNQRLDHLNRRLELALQSLSQELYKSSRELNLKVDGFNDSVNQRLDKAFHDLGRTMEYTKLLHSLSHNVVVEMSKLKIEEEGLKLKTRIMEKDFENLRSKEQALEHKVFK